MPVFFHPPITGDSSALVRGFFISSYMRLKVLDDDPGEYITPSSERIRVYLNGVEVKHVYSADDVKGEVITAVLDSRWRFRVRTIK